jgi:hypothetical protein
MAKFLLSTDSWLVAKYIECAEAVDMNGRFQMQGGKNWILSKYVNANRFFWDSHWLEIWSNHFCPSMGLNRGSVATDSEQPELELRDGWRTLSKRKFFH